MNELEVEMGRLDGEVPAWWTYHWAGLMYWFQGCVNGKRSVQTGVGEGHTTLVLGYAARKAGGLHISVDIDSERVERVRGLIKRYGLSEWCRCEVCSSLQWPLYGGFDVIFLDSDHTYGYLVEEFKLYSGHLSEWGAMFFHDIDADPGPRRFWKELTEGKFGDWEGLWWPHKKGLGMARPRKKFAGGRKMRCRDEEKLGVKL